MESQRYLTEEQITTREFFMKVGKFFQLIFKNWRWLVLGLFLGGIISIIQDLINKKEKQYTANLSFNLDIGGSGGGQNQMAGLAASLGLPGMGGQQMQSGDITSGANFPAVIQSKVAFERAMMQEVQVYGKPMLMANYYKDSSNLSRTNWGGNIFKDAKEGFIKYRFTKKNPRSFTRKENEIMQEMFLHAIENTAVLPSANSTITILSFKTTNEMLAKVYVETLLDATQEFYADMRTQKTRKLLSMQQSRLDSLKRLMHGSDRQVAQLTFQNQNVVDPAGPLRQQIATKNSTFYSSQYYNQLATVESYQRALFDNMPILTVFQEVRLPLPITQTGVGENLLFGALIGLLLALIYVLIRQAVRSIRADMATV